MMAATAVSACPGRQSDHHPGQVSGVLAQRLERHELGGYALPRRLGQPAAARCGAQERCHGPR